MFSIQGVRSSFSRARRSLDGKPTCAGSRNNTPNCLILNGTPGGIRTPIARFAHTRHSLIARDSPSGSKNHARMRKINDLRDRRGTERRTAAWSGRIDGPDGRIRPSISCRLSRDSNSRQMRQQDARRCELPPHLAQNFGRTQSSPNRVSGSISRRLAASTELACAQIIRKPAVHYQAGC